MLTKKKVSTIILTSTLTFFTACGGGGGGGSDTPTPSNEQIVPSNINVAIPPSLKGNRNSGGATSPKTTLQKASFKANSTAVPSRGYSELQTTISMAEEVIQSTKENMVYLNSMMPDIQSECQGTAINTPCTIPADTITLTITSQINQKLAKVAQEFNAQAEALPVGTTFILGQVKYTEFNNTHPYQYDVVLDLKPALNRLGANVTKDLETVRWSADKNGVQTLSDVQDSDGSYTMNLTYKKEDNGSAFMKITDTFNMTTQPQVSGVFSLTLNELKDAQNTIQVDSTGTINDATNGTIKFSSKGEVTDNGGSLTSTGEFGGNKFAEKESFDGQGALKQSKYCDDSDENNCTLDDEDSWHTFDETLGTDSSDFNEDELTTTPTSYFVDLVVTGGSLQDGMCELLPPSFDTTHLEDGIGIIEKSIGNLSAFQNDASAILYDKSYVNQLDALKIVCFLPTSDGLDANFVELTGADRPTLTAP